MTQQEKIEAEIWRILAEESRAVPLSNKLFNQEDGLFGKLADTQEERRAVARSELFQHALHRLTELQRKEAEEFRNILTHLPAEWAQDGLFKLEKAGPGRVPPQD